MRLICPNCEAQYEVDADVIPDEGRDVQCSSCGNTWLQMPEGAKAAEEQESLALVPEEPAKDEPKRRTLDAAVLSVLREEAERETLARRAEGSALETQGDLGLVAGAAAPVAARDEPEPTKPAPLAEPEETEPLVSRATKRELLPDIEQINSTLRPTSERGNEAAAQDAPQVLRIRRNDFRKGFFSSLLVAVLLLALYMMSDAIAARVPALEPALSGYARTVDGVRQWLDQAMRSTTESLNEPASN